MRKKILLIIILLILAHTVSAACTDNDGDGFFIEGEGCGAIDCNDNDAEVNPGVQENCGTLYDDNCNRYANEGCDFCADLCVPFGACDQDGDGYSNDVGMCSICDTTCGVEGGDWYDDNPDQNPGIVEEGCLCNDGIDNDADGFWDDNEPECKEICNGQDDNCNGEIDEGVLIDYYIDSDSDGYGNPGITQQGCTAPAGYVADNTDCNDNDGAVFEEIILYPDSDQDTYGADSPVPVCTDGTVPVGYSNQGTDCNDNNAGIFKSMILYVDNDRDGIGAGNSVQLCTDGSAPVGYGAWGTDCNDSDAAINPLAEEVCNGRDDDCDNSVDEGVGSTFYQDADADTYGSVYVNLHACTAPAGYVSNSLDCNDSDASVHPQVDEICGNGIDDNCNDLTDSQETICQPCNPGDQMACQLQNGVCFGSQQTCTAEGIWPGCDQTTYLTWNASYQVTETSCDYIDNDCDYHIDEGLRNLYYLDADSDLFGNANKFQTMCFRPVGYVSNSQDCNDDNNTINPDALELCNGVDDDCDTSIDEGCTACTTGADTSGDGVISISELLSYISSWKQGNITLANILAAIGFWKTGNGC